MHHLFLRKKIVADELTQYSYVFADQGFSPANQILTRLFREMVLAVEHSLDQLEVEYIDHKMAKELGIKRASELLNLLGATKENVEEYKQGDVVLSRKFRATLKTEALEYFKRIQDLEELAAYRLYSGSLIKVEVYFAKTMSVFVNPIEEQQFFDQLNEQKLKYKLIF